MPKEEEKKSLKILGVDKYSPESTFLLGYVTLFTTVQHRSDSLSRNFRLEVGDGIRGLTAELKALISLDLLSIKIS